MAKDWRSAVAGDRLLHLDVRTDNMLVRADDAAVLVDWPWAAAGAPVLDLVAFLPSAVLDGAGDPERLLRTVRAGREADPEQVTCLLAAFCGMMEEQSRRAAAPGLPGLRACQAAQAAATAAWLCSRAGWG